MVLVGNPEELRPLVHFTPEYGFMNDPNGLVKYRDTWFLFYQWNPTDVVHGFTHWGLAKSKDLMHWEHCKAAIIPDDVDGNIYSGSAVVDYRNVSGLKQGEHDPILLFYTGLGFIKHPEMIRNADGSLSYPPDWERPATRQCIAYSLDGGETFEKYLGNPVLPEYSPINRDPKVNFIEEENAYVLALFLQEHDYCLFWSEDLLHWEKGQTITMPHSAECPDIFSLKLDGKEKKWIFFGSPDNYLVGHFSNRTFVAETEEIQGSVSLHSDFSIGFRPTAYAPQTFYAPGEDRVVQISWLNTHFPGALFQSEMSIPWELSLVSTAEGPRIVKSFARELSLVRGDRIRLSGDSKDVLNKELCPRVYWGQVRKQCPVEIMLRAEVTNASSFGFSTYGIPFWYDGVRNCLLTPTGVLQIPERETEIDIHFLSDRGGIELFAAKGRINFVLDAVIDFAKPSFMILHMEKAKLEIQKYELSL